MDEENGEVEAGVDIDEANNELYLSEGECWIRDVYALADGLGALGFSNVDGVVCAIMPGRGFVDLADLLKKRGKLAAVPAK